jgi:putative restriction endonuclease
MLDRVDAPSKWLRKLVRLRVDRARGDPAPHKPLLLLAMLDLAEEGDLSRTVVPLGPELAFRFLAYWRFVAERRRQPPDVRLPFHHLKGDGFWSPVTATGEPSNAPSLTQRLIMPDDLLAFIRDPANRALARRLLVSTYFEPPERVALYTALGMPVPTDDVLRSDAKAASDAAVEQGREARFRIRVVSAYRYTCALTGYRLTTVRGGSIVDAAHIHQFARSRNNSVDNGIALSKNAHWLFDQGLWTISDKHTVVVAEGKFAEHDVNGHGLAERHGKRLFLPEDASIWPNPIHLAWHRANCFRLA